MARILLLSTMSYAGMGPYVASIVNSFQPDDNIRFFLVEDESHYYSRNIKDSLKPLTTIVCQKKSSKLRTAYELLFDGKCRFRNEIITICKSENIKIVHSLVSTGDLGLVDWLNNNVLFLYTVHDLHPHEAKKIFYKQWRQKIIYKRISKAINKCRLLYTNSLAQLEEMNIIYPNRYNYYSNFPSLVTDEIAFGNTMPPEIENIDNYLLFFGRIEAYKGVELLIDAFKKSNNPKRIKLVIAGKGELQRGPDENIIYINRYIKDSEIANLYKKALCVIYPYISATQSGVLSIASYFRTPIIASDVCFFKEVLGHDYPLLFQAGSVNDLTIKISMITDGDKHIDYSMLSGEIFETRYSSFSLREQLFSIYTQLR